MKKDKIYVVIDSKQKRLRAIQILNDAGVEIRFSMGDRAYYMKFQNGYFFDFNGFSRPKSEYTEITLDQLEQLLANDFDFEFLKIEDLKEQAALLGYELVKKKREVKVGDFGKFWDEIVEDCVFGFLTEIGIDGFFDKFYTASWKNFAHLTDEEKQQIKENW